MDRYLIDPSAEFPVSELPTLKDVLRKGRLMKERSAEWSEKNEHVRFAGEMAPDIYRHYKKVNTALLIASPLTIRIRLGRALNEVRNANHGRLSHIQIKRLEQKLGKRFDIMKCKYRIISCKEWGCPGSAHHAHSNCCCRRNH